MDLNKKANTIMPLKENIWEYLYDLGIGENFLGIKNVKCKAKLSGDSGEHSRQSCVKAQRKEGARYVARTEKRPEAAKQRQGKSEVIESRRGMQGPNHPGLVWS